MDKVNSDWWDGTITKDNARDVADALERKLTGKKFTFVGVVEGRDPEVHPDQKLEGGTGGKNVWLYTDTTHIVVSDTYGVFGFGAGDTIEFEGRSVKIRTTAGNGRGVLWTITLQR